MLIFEDTGLLLYCLFVTVLAGAVLGSFLNCAAWRIAHHESFLKGRSHCTTCGHVLGPLDLIPVVSYLISGGKCRYCGDPISIRYPMTELFFAGLSVICLLRCDLSLLFARDMVLICCLFCLSLVDLECQIIPDGCLVISAAAWLIYAVVCPGESGILMTLGSGLLSAVIYGGGILVISLIMDKVLGRESLGGGDVKLFAVAGLYLGLIGSLFAMLLACLIGLVSAAFLRKGGRSAAFPFGPSIAAAIWLMLMFGGGLVSWYMGLF